MAKTTLNLSPPLMAIQAEAEAMGISFPALLTADLVRYRKMAETAVPAFDAWQWGLLGHLLSGAEFHRIISGDDSLPSALSIAAGIDEWADDASDDEVMRAGKLREVIAGLSSLAVAGILMRLRNG